MTDELSEIHDLEVFDSEQFPEWDVARIAQNFEEIGRLTGEQIQPPLVIGHSEDQAVLRDSGLPAAGWISALRAAGTRLLADVRDVPRLVAEAIRRRAYTRISAELYRDYKDLGPALRRVALLGGAIPKVKTLQDVIALHSDDEPFETITTVLDDARPEVVDLPAPAPEEPQPDAPDPDAARRRLEVQRFCEDLKRDGHYAPAWDELGLPEFLAGLDEGRVVCFAEGSEQTARGWFEQFLRRLPAVVSFSEKAPAAAGPADPGRTRLCDFYRRHQRDFERLGVSLGMFLDSEGR